MQTLTCPIPSNINPLQSNGFMFGIHKLPEINYFCQEVTLPSLDLPTAIIDTPLSRIPHPGDKLDFGALSLTFLLDEDMINYVALHNWLIGLGFPESHAQFAQFINDKAPALASSSEASSSDAVLQILNSSNNVSRTIHFIDVIPTSLSQITLQSTTTDTTYIAASATFQYSYYKFE